jgi:uncharacterized DUF497 family protein
MYDDILKYIQSRVRALHYVMTLHAEEEMENDGLSIYDVEQALLNGSIIERQADQRTSEWKYVIRGNIGQHDELCVVSKVSTTGMVVIITVYVLS